MMIWYQKIDYTPYLRNIINSRYPTASGSRIEITEIDLGLTWFQQYLYCSIKFHQYLYCLNYIVNKLVFTRHIDNDCI